MKKSVWKLFFNLLYQVKLPYFLILLYTVLSVVGSQLYLMFPSYTQQIMAGDISRRIIVMVILIVLGDSLLTSVKQFILSVASARVTFRCRNLIWRQVLRLPPSFFDRQTPGGLISRVTEDTTKLSDLAATFPGNTISAIYEFAGSVVILFSYHWKLAAVEALVIPLLHLIGVWQGRVQFSWNSRIQEKTAGLTGGLSEILLNLPLVKSFVKEDSEQMRGEDWIRRLFRVRFKSTLMSNLLVQAGGLAKVFHTVLVIGVGIWLISENEITIDIWIAFYLYSQGLLNSFSRVMSIWGTVKSGQGAVRRITELMEEAQEETGEKVWDESCENVRETEGEKERGAACVKINEEGAVSYGEGDIVFREVSFGYETFYAGKPFGQKIPVLENLSFTIPKGKTTALIGLSGAGKTTVFQLLERLYQPDKGCIYVGDARLLDIPLEAWRKSLGYVPQDPYLFSGTIRENILYGIHRNVTEEALYRTLRQSQVLEFLDKLPEGLETQIGEEGKMLSGGQRQRIAIARVMLNEPRLILLDESTSSLDIESEILVERALACLKQGRTTVVIAHKMTAVKEADQIIVLKDGNVNAAGTHISLRNTNELYRQFLSIQGQAVSDERIMV